MSPWACGFVRLVRDLSNNYFIGLDGTMMIKRLDLIVVDVGLSLVRTSRQTLHFGVGEILLKELMVKVY